MTHVAAWFSKLFRKARPLIGVVHVAPLPGAPSKRSLAAIRGIRDHLLELRDLDLSLLPSAGPSP